MRFLELNSFGREFKLNGYTLTNNPGQIEAADDQHHETLQLPDTADFGDVPSGLHSTLKSVNSTRKTMTRNFRSN